MSETDNSSASEETLLMPSRILVVDDEPDLEHLVRQRMRREIRSGSYTFVFASNGVEALEMLSEDEEIDMVLSDINMPLMDGLTLLKQIPSVNPNIRSVIVSAYGDMKNIRTAMNRGAFDFIGKPIDFDDLKVTIKRTLEHLSMWRSALASRDKLVALQQELDVASSIQMSILPTKFPASSECEIFGNMKPARNVGGDFFDIVQTSDDLISIAIADVSDKGVPAALFMMSCRTWLKAEAGDKSVHPAEILKGVNAQLVKDNDAMMFVTLFYAVYNTKTGEMCFANGGHNPPVIVHQDGSSDVFPSTKGIALGVVPDAEFEQSSITLEVGEFAVLYTDGVTEAENAEFELFEMERLRGIFAANMPVTAKSANEAVFASVKEFANGHPQSDDTTCVTLLRKS